MNENVVDISPKEKSTPDLLFSFITTPPLVIPISEEARKLVNLPEDCDCGIYLSDHPTEVMKHLKQDFIVAEAVDFTPAKIASLTIKLLH